MRAKPSRQIVTWLLLIGGSLAAPSFILAQNPVAPPNAPEGLRPPNGRQLLLHLKGKGNQIYVCQKSGAGYSWKLKAPDANLMSEDGVSAGRHFAGPTWESIDGSRVMGKVAASVPSPSGNSIPWLLLTKTATEGSGIMSRVQSIQRLNTEGGVAPKDGCTSSNENSETSVPYQADYYFYGPISTQ